MEPDDRRKQTRKLAGVIFIFLIICVIITLIILNINRDTEDPDDDTIETESYAVEEEYVNTETFAFTNHPISALLPIINDDPSYCISYDVSTTEDGDYTFNLTVDYKTEEGKDAAKAALETSELSNYNPSQYNIIYTQVDDN